MFLDSYWLYFTSSAAYGSLESPQERIDTIPMIFRDQLSPKFLNLPIFMEEKKTELTKPLDTKGKAV